MVEAKNVEDILKDCGLEKNLQQYTEMTADAKARFAEQVIKMGSDNGPMGLKNYTARARKLLESSRNNVNPFDGYKPSIPSGVYLRPEEDEFADMEEAGMAELCKLGFVLIAGGLGERLGFSSIKISLPVATVTEDDYSYMKYYA